MKELILCEREESSMASSWDEYLVLRLKDDGSYLLFTGKFEVLEDASGYWNDETEDYDLPEEIDGKEVLWVSDGYVIGGDLDYFNAEEAVEFKKANSKTVRDWLEATAWADDVDIGDVAEGIEKIQTQ